MLYKRKQIDVYKAGPCDCAMLFSLLTVQYLSITLVYYNSLYFDKVFTDHASTSSAMITLTNTYSKK